jgi:hypothetical protein
MSGKVVTILIRPLVTAVINKEHGGKLGTVLSRCFSTVKR